MALSTTALRAAYAPACTGKGDRFIDAWTALDRVLAAHRYAPRQADSGAYNCRPITGGTGFSLHAYGPGSRFSFWNGTTMATALAVDINWTTNPYGPRLVTDMPRAMIDDVYKIRTRSGAQVWRWGGYYTANKDAMHFEIVCGPADLATGIDWTTVADPGDPEEDEDMPGSIWCKDNDRNTWWLVAADQSSKWRLPNHDVGRTAAFLGARFDHAANFAFVAAGAGGRAWLDAIPVRPHDVGTEVWMQPLKKDTYGLNAVARDALGDVFQTSRRAKANTESILAALPSIGADIDEDALATALASLIAGQVADAIAAVADHDLDAIARAVADETDRRARERLG